MIRHADAEIVIRTRQGVSLESVRAIDRTSYDRAVEILDGYDVLMVPAAIYNQVANYVDSLINDNGLDLPEHEYIYCNKFTVRTVMDDINTAFDHEETELTEAESDDLLSD